MHGMMRTRSVVSAPRACRGGGYRRFRRNARAPWVNCWRRPSPLGAGPRCPWIGSRHGMTWQRPTACSRMGAAVRLLLSPFFATSCSRGGARAASRFGSVAEICRRAGRDVGLDGWRVAPRGRPDRASLVAGCGDSRARHRWHGIGGYAARNACRPAAGRRCPAAVVGRPSLVVWPAGGRARVRHAAGRAGTHTFAVRAATRPC